MSIGGTFIDKHMITFICRLLKWVYTIHRSISRTFEVILSRLEVCLPRYEFKSLLTGQEIGFTTFSFLFLEHLRLFYVD